MSLSLYMDVHVPRAITRTLSAAGVDVVTAQEDGCSHMPDPELLDRAGSLGRVLFTRDDDLLAEAGPATKVLGCFRRRGFRPPNAGDHRPMCP